VSQVQNEFPHKVLLEQNKSERARVRAKKSLSPTRLNANTIASSLFLQLNPPKHGLQDKEKITVGFR